MFNYYWQKGSSGPLLTDMLARRVRARHLNKIVHVPVMLVRSRDGRQPHSGHGNPEIESDPPISPWLRAYLWWLMSVFAEPIVRGSDIADPMPFQLLEYSLQLLLRKPFIRHTINSVS